MTKAVVHAAVLANVLAAFVVGEGRFVVLEVVVDGRLLVVWDWIDIAFESISNAAG